VPVLDDITEDVLRRLFHVVIEIVFFYTGEYVLYVLTFGKKPRWDFYENEKPLKLVNRTEISCWIVIATLLKSFWKESRKTDSVVVAPIKQDEICL
jgi:hypothetical protein